MTLRPLAALALLLALPAAAQTALPPTNDAAFAPLDLPAPTATRAADGRPGHAYWQNRNDYRIAVSLDPATHTVRGTVALDYTNNAPLALPHLWFHLEQNLFAPESRGARRTPADSRWRGAFADGGYRIERVTVDGRPAEPVITDTRMRIDLERPVAASGGTVRVEVAYSFVVPEYGADRMGRLETERGTVYELAQWYPRIAVYDDVNGWNALPYLGQGEFYLGYGDFELELTVPSTMQVVATGTLLNAGEVYTDEQLRRIAAARQSDQAVHIVAPDEVGAAAAPRRPTTTTWRYRAESVRDVAWAASNAFIVDAAGAAIVQADGSINDVLVMSAYPHEGIGTEAEPGWEEATRYGRESLIANSRWFPYPYPVVISVAGVVGGMEYPMLHFSGVGRRHMSLFGVVDHEIAHNWFPMIVGSDERRHAWMDEGFASYLGVFANRAFYTDTDRPEVPGVAVADSARVIRLTQTEAAADFLRQPYSDQPTMTYPDRIRRAGLGWLAYRKPAKGLLILRDAVLGPERMDAAFMAYAERWAYKHPQPADFFRTVEDVAGEDLDWFWRQWFMGTGRYDAALTALAADGDVAVATVENRAEMVFPVVVEFAFADGTVERANVPVEAFFQSDTFGASVPLRGRTVTGARLDPDTLLPDDDRSNDGRSADGRR